MVAAAANQTIIAFLATAASDDGVVTITAEAATHNAVIADAAIGPLIEADQRVVTSFTVEKFSITGSLAT